MDLAKYHHKAAVTFLNAGTIKQSTIITPYYSPSPYVYENGSALLYKAHQTRTRVVRANTSHGRLQILLTSRVLGEVYTQYSTEAKARCHHMTARTINAYYIGLV